MVTARNDKEQRALTGFLLVHAGVQPSADLQCIGWLDENRKVVIVVGFNGFIGKVAQIHIAFAPDWHFAPRKMLREAFRYAFNDAGRELLVGVVNSKNERAMRFDEHLGFRELFRLPQMHDDGGDLVLLGMRRAECRYLQVNGSEHDAVHAV